MNMYVPHHGQRHLAQAIGLAIVGALLLVAIVMNTIFGGRGTTGTFRPEAVPTPPPELVVTAAPSPVPYPPQ